MTQNATRGRSRQPGAINGLAYPPSWKFDLDRPKRVPDTPDDDFDTGTLDAKWTVVAGTAGICDLTYSGGSRYDVTSRPSWLLMQVNNGNHVKLRQDFALPDGKSIVLKLAPTLSVSGQSGLVNNAIYAMLTLNDSDTGFDTGNYVWLGLDTDLDGWRYWYAQNPGTVMATPGAKGGPISHSMYFRILRNGLDYYGYFSEDGTTWFAFAKATMPAALTNIWIVVAGNAAIASPTPMQAVDWIRLGGNGIDPW